MRCSNLLLNRRKGEMNSKFPAAIFAANLLEIHKYR